MTAVEFALIAPLFFALLFAIIEVAMIFFASQVLETATQDSSRFVMTGQAQGANYTQAQFKTFVCGEVSSALFDCTNGIYVDVRSYPATSFSTVNLTPITDPTQVKWCPGKDGDVVVVRLFYQWPLFVTKAFTSSFLSNGKRLLIATATFKNEPSGTAGTTCS